MNPPLLKNAGGCRFTNVMHPPSDIDRYGLDCVVYFTHYFPCLLKDKDIGWYCLGHADPKSMLFTVSASVWWWPFVLFCRRRRDGWRRTSRSGERRRPRGGRRWMIRWTERPGSLSNASSPEDHRWRLETELSINPAISWLTGTPRTRDEADICIISWT